MLGFIRKQVKHCVRGRPSSQIRTAHWPRHRFGILKCPILVIGNTRNLMARWLVTTPEPSW